MASYESSSKTTPKRQVTDKRREQNRRNQKAYRDRLKARFEELEAKEQVLDESATNISAPRPTSPPAAKTGTTIDVQDAFVAAGDLALPTDPLRPIAPFNIVIGRRSKKPQQSAGSTPSTEPMPTTVWSISTSDSSTSPITPEDFKGIEDLSRELQPYGPPSSVCDFRHLLYNRRGPHRRPSNLSPLPPSLLRLNGENHFSALLTIATSIGISHESYLSDSLSPFYVKPEDQAALYTGAYDFSFMPRDMRPTHTQLTIGHPSYLDCIPYPIIRDAAIRLNGTGELDHGQLFLDMVHDGLICWGSETPNGMNSGVPWSKRSWEVRPWFLKKWWFLVGDREDEVWENSRWWWEMRGESENNRLGDIEEPTSDGSRVRVHWSTHPRAMIFNGEKFDREKHCVNIEAV